MAKGRASAEKKRPASALKVTLLKSPIGSNRRQRQVVVGMGLRRIRQSVTLADTPSARGMVHKVRHLVTVERV